MGGLDQALIDAIIEYQIDLRRVEAGTVKSVLNILTRMQNELVVTLSSQTPLTEFNKARKADLLRQVTAVLNKYYLTAQGELALSTDGLAQAQAEHTVRTLNTTLAISTGASLPSEAVVTRLGDNRRIEGGPLASWWQRLATDTSFKLSNAIRQGIVQGETNAQIIARVVGKAGQPGIMEIAKRNAAAVVQTATQAIANDARLKTFESNADVVLQLEWFSALDSHVCPRCMALSGKKWLNSRDGTHAPVGHSVPFQSPPIHFNDRCVMLPITKLSAFMPKGTRASEGGQVPSSTTFDDWLSRRTPAQQDEQLGVGRAQMWRDKKITLAQLIDGKGRELTLSQLQAKYK